jgi:hypothetical protein
MKEDRNDKKIAGKKSNYERLKIRIVSKTDVQTGSQIEASRTLPGHSAGIKTYEIKNN